MKVYEQDFDVVMELDNAQVTFSRADYHVSNIVLDEKYKTIVLQGANESDSIQINFDPKEGSEIIIGTGSLYSYINTTSSDANDLITELNALLTA